MEITSEFDFLFNRPTVLCMTKPDYPLSVMSKLTSTSETQMTLANQTDPNTLLFNYYYYL